MENGQAEVKDEIDFIVAATGRGLKVKVKYEQEIEVEIEDSNEKEDKPEEEDDKDKENEEKEEEDNKKEKDDADIEVEDGDEERALQEAEQETETQFEVYFDSIIEYAKGDSSDHSSAYDWEKDEIVQTIDLDTWTDFSQVSTSGPTSTFSVTSPDGKVGFSFTINQAAEGAEMTANKIKVDFKLNEFPWTREDSYVSLLSTVETEQKIDVEYDEDEDSVEMIAAKDVLISFTNVQDTSSYTPTGEYSWVETAEVQPKVETDSVALQSVEGAEEGLPEIAIPKTIKVIATSPKVESERRRVEGKSTQSIAFSFVGDAAHQAKDIFWDPTAGIQYSESSSANRVACAMGVSVAGILALFSFL